MHHSENTEKMHYGWDKFILFDNRGDIQYLLYQFTKPYHFIF